MRIAAYTTAFFIFLTLAGFGCAASATNMVVDFDATDLDANLAPGESGILNLVVMNAGGYAATNIEVHLPSTAIISADKKFYIGELAAGSSTTLPVAVRINPNAKTGLSAVNVRISFDGRDSSGQTVTADINTWDVPIRVYSKPVFQIEPWKIEYSKDNVDSLAMTGKLRSDVKDLQATLSSDCADVLGTSQKYVGSVSAGEGFELSFQIKPSTEGACSTSLQLEYTDESGNRAVENQSVGINVLGAGVDFKVEEVSYEPLGPGEKFSLDVKLINVGDAGAQDVTVSLGLADPFIPVDTTEKYVGDVDAGKTIDASFDISVSWDAEIAPYAVPLKVEYKVGGTSYSVEKNIGIDVSGDVQLEIIKVDTSRGNVQVNVANLGTRPAEGVKATLIMPQRNQSGQDEMSREEIAERQASMQERASSRGSSGSLGMLSGRPQRGGFTGRQAASSGTQGTVGGDQVDYKSDIKPTKETTFTFSSTPSGRATLVLEYAGPNNERVTQTEVLNLGASSGYSSSSDPFQGKGSGSPGKAGILLLGVVLAGGFIIYRRRKKK